MRPDRLLIVILFLFAGSYHAQVDTLIRPTPETPDLEEAIEDLILNTETEGQVDYSYLTDFLQSLREHPLDLNIASREELLQLPGMDDLIINKLFQHIQRFGSLTSIYELQAVSGFPMDVCRNILPFVTVKQRREKDIDSQTLHPAGPSWKEIKKGLKFNILQRFTWIAEEQRGYTVPDTTFKEIRDDEGILLGIDTSLSSRYLGSPFRTYTRIQGGYYPNVSFALIGEKDPGEQFKWAPAERLYGYDFLSGHIALKNFGRLKRLVIGDYTLQVAQGMVLSRGLGFGKGAQVIRGVKRANRGIQAYRSVNENQFFRGAAASYALGKLSATAFFSRMRLDGNIQAVDTLSNEALVASSIQLGGLHRTLSQLIDRRGLKEAAMGGRVEYRSQTLTIGSTYFYQQFGGQINPPNTDYNLFAFRGRENYLNSFDFDWVVQNFNFFGEFARSKSGGTGSIIGMMSSLSPTVDVSLVARRFSEDFHSFRAYVFSERPTAAQNETGVYLGIRIAPNPKWTFNTYFDQFYFPWNKFRTAYPSAGWEFMGQLRYKYNRNTQVYVRFRSDNQERNASEYPIGQQVRYTTPTRRNQLRLHVQTKIERDIQYRSRLEFSWFDSEQNPTKKGVLLYQDLIWKWGFKWKATARYALFDIPEFDARIYAYENDILGFFSIPAYSGVGSRYYLIFNGKITRSWECWLRVAQTRLRNSSQIGSGLERIQGNTRTEVKVQLRYSF